MAKKEFQAESKKLMDMMINSIYTNKEIFLRELISNASDAIDKLYYKSLTDTSVGMNKSDFRILITRDKENRILTVEDNGIGMTKDKSRMYALVQQAAEQYRTRNGGGSIICRELLAKAGAVPAGGTAAEDRTADYYKKRPCPELCRICADLCAEFIAAHPEGRHGFYREDA